MNISDKGIAFIKEFEGCKLTAYKCSAGVLTIGWGHTGEVKPGETITQYEADQLFLKDIKPRVDAVNRLVKADITQGMFDALVSFAYNLGIQALAGSTMLKMINAGSQEAAAEQFLRWDRAAGRQVPGLTRRRRAEMDLYNSENTI